MTLHLEPVAVTEEDGRVVRSGMHDTVLIREAIIFSRIFKKAEGLCHYAEIITASILEAISKGYSRIFFYEIRLHSCLQFICNAMERMGIIS